MFGCYSISRVKTIGICVAILKQCFGLRVPYNFGPLGHIQASKQIWRSVVRPGDTVVDATCGNGHDSLYLASLALTPREGKLYCIDIQSEATTSTRNKFASDPMLSTHLSEDRVSIITDSHETFPPTISPLSVALICYNLGYLPGAKSAPSTFPSSEADGSSSAQLHKLITKSDTTIISLTNALPLIKDGGLLSVVAYPGHEGGDVEAEAVKNFLAALDSQEWRVYGNYPLNRPKSPVLMSAFRIDKTGKTKHDKL